MRLSSFSLCLSRRPSLFRLSTVVGTRRIIHNHNHNHLPFAAPFPNRPMSSTDLSFPRRTTTISSRTRKTRKPARRRTRKRRRCTSRARNREVRRRRRPEYSARRASFWKGEFYSDFERKRDVGCTLSFFLSLARSRAPGAKTRGLPDVLIILSFFLSLFFSLSPFSCCVRACFLSVLTPRLAVFRSVPSFR